MSVDIWPPIAPGDLKVAVEETLARELLWLLDELHETLRNLKHGLEDCYALLAPIDPGSTLVVSTPRHETVKGHVTRVGTRIVKGTLALRLRTLPAQTLVLDPTHPIHLAPLTQLHSLLTEGLDILTQTLAHLPTPSSASSPPTTKQPGHSRRPSSGTAAFISAQLRLLSTALADAAAVLKGPPLTASDPGWTTLSTAPAHFLPPPAPHSNNALLASLTSAIEGSGHDSSGAAAQEAALQNVSIYWGIQDSALVLWVRSLEPAHAPVNLGMKFALAIGTARRLEHDESERIFGYCCASLDGRPGAHGPGAAMAALAAVAGSSRPSSSRSLRPASSPAIGRKPSRTNLFTGGGGGDRTEKSGGGTPGEVEVYVREKVRVESQDPSLLSLSAKLNALGSTLGLARRNLAAVMGEEVEE